MEEAGLSMEAGAQDYMEVVEGTIPPTALASANASSPLLFSIPHSS